jgi:hypothetical protein
MIDGIMNGILAFLFVHDIKHISKRGSAIS